MLSKKCKEWGGKMTIEEFNNYMNKRFNEMIDRLCPPIKEEDNK